MKSLKQRLKKQDVPLSSQSAEWNKYDERLLRAVENDDVDKVTATLKKGAVPTKLDSEGHSAFHLAASKGLINSLNIFLGHGVNLHTADPAGKTALHLSAGGGHSVCVQRLLQCKSPIDSTDLHGRTALHDAAYAGHSTIIRMLCDSGASVSAVDKDGRPPLLLAAQASRPRACQQLLQCGATTTLRDKHNKTALTLACEYPCREIVEVLLKHKADITAVDLYGHDPYHYARLSEDPALISMVKQAWEAANKAKEAASTAQKTQLQRSSIAGAEAHMRKPSLHSPAKAPGVGWSSSGAVKMDRAPTQQHVREHGGRTADGNDDPQHHGLDPAQVRHLGPHPATAAPSVRNVPRPVDVLTGEVEVLRRELWEARRRLEGAEGEVMRLDAALAMRAREYEELRRSSERALQEAHGRAWELEEALGDVQRRMAGSESRVRQMQAHLVSVRENLVEDLRMQLHEARARSEAAVAELEQTRRELGLSRREVKEQREQQGTLMEEVRRLSEELHSREEHTKALQSSLAAVEARRGEMTCEVTQTPSDWQPTSPRSTMTDLTNEILQREMDKTGYVTLEEHEAVRSSISEALQQAQHCAQEALQRQQRAEQENQSLLRELQEQKTELDTLQEALQDRFVPVALLQEKERELVQLRQALKEMEESKEKDQTTVKTHDQQEEFQKSCNTKPQSNEIQPGRVSTDKKVPQVSAAPHKSSKTSSTIKVSSITLKEVNTLPDLPEGQDKGAEVVVKTKTQRETQRPLSPVSKTGVHECSDCSTLQAQINNLQQQLEKTEVHYKDVLAIYRTRLLNAAQGYMDEEARTALLQIAQMRQECVY